MNKDERFERMVKLRTQIAGCQRCRLHATRTNTVPGEGSLEAKIMFIGEAPGRNEDMQGKPFVGRAGDVFDKLLASIELTRNDIYLCNILKCRPPENREPLSDEVHSCVGSLDIQITIINPQVIATLGRYATTYILQKFSLPLRNISTLHGQAIDVETPLGKKKIVPLFHPAVATYDPGKLDVLIQDIQILKTISVDSQSPSTQKIERKNLSPPADSRIPEALFGMPEAL